MSIVPPTIFIIYFFLFFIPKANDFSGEETVYSPSPQYEADARRESIKLENPTRQLIILDLNGTLVWRDRNAGSGKFAIHTRPYLDQFFEYLFSSYEVMVWSSAQPINVQKIISKAFGNKHASKLKAVWARDAFGLDYAQYHQKTLTIKDLDQVWDYFNNINKKSHVRGNRDMHKWDQTNTILIDDSDLKAQKQPYNAIHLPEYDGPLHYSRRDESLKKVISYLLHLRYQSNVSNYIRSNPYEIKPETPRQYHKLKRSKDLEVERGGFEYFQDEQWGSRVSKELSTYRAEERCEYDRYGYDSHNNKASQSLEYRSKDPRRYKR